MSRQQTAVSVAAFLIMAGARALAAEGGIDETSRMDGKAEVTRSVVVPVTAFDPASDEDGRALERKLEAAARRVCGPIAAKPLAAQRSWKTCYSAALADALEQAGQVHFAGLSAATR